MIADCETCDPKQVPCFACRESQRAICFICAGDVADPYCELDKHEQKETAIRTMVADRDRARAVVAGAEMERPYLRPSYLEQMRAHIDEGGQLSHRNGLDLLAEVERLQGLVPRYLGGTRA